jgi:uncharacterized protein
LAGYFSGESKMRKLNCDGCGGLCCKYITVEIKEPKTKEDYEEILWYFLHPGIEVFIEDGKWNILFNSKCSQLDKDFKCKIYEKRPEVCRNHSINECEKFGKNATGNYYFKNYKEFVLYMESIGISVRKIE